MKRILYKPVIGFLALSAAVFMTVQCDEKQEEAPYLTAESLLVEAEAGQTSATLNFNSNTQWKVEYESDWLSSGDIKYGEGDGLLELALLPNENVDVRECVLTVSAETASLEPLQFTVRQYGTAPLVSCAEDTLYVGQMSGTEKVGVSANVSWTAASESGWLSLDRQADTLLVSYEANDVSEVRSARIVVSAAEQDVHDTVVIVQEARTPPYLNAPAAVTLSPYAGTEKVAVEANVDYTVESSSTWLTAARTDGGVLLTYGDNGIDPRNAEVLLTPVAEGLDAVSVKVTQEGMPLSKRQSDSLALVTFYNNTAGENWTIKWDLTQPMSTWEGVVLTEEGRVKELRLWEKNIVGELGDCLTVLDAVELIHFGGGNDLRGELSPKFAQLRNLYQLALQKNNLEGSIPAEFGSMDNLVDFYIDGNRFSGEIPEEIFQNPNWPRWLEFGFKNQQEGYGFTN